MDVFTAIDQNALAFIRKTAELPPKVSVYDVIGAITGKNTDDAGKTYRRLVEQHPEVRTSSPDFTFYGRGQRPTPIADAREITEVVMLLQGRGAAQFRKKSADVVVRFSGGDPHIVEEIAANRLAQQNLPENHPMRIFGETVEGESEELRKKREAVQLAELDLQLADIRGRAKKHESKASRNQ